MFSEYLSFANSKFEFLKHLSESKEVVVDAFPTAVLDILSELKKQESNHLIDTNIVKAQQDILNKLANKDEDYKSDTKELLMLWLIFPTVLKSQESIIGMIKTIEDTYNLLNDDRTRQNALNEIKSQLFSKLLNIDSAPNCSILPEKSAIYISLLLNAFFRYYQHHNVTALSFIFINPLIQSLNLAASIAAGYFITTLVSNYIYNTYLLEDKSKLPLTSIYGSIHIENYFTANFGQGFYNSLSLSKFNFISNREVIYNLSEHKLSFRESIDARKAILNKYSHYQSIYRQDPKQIRYYRPSKISELLEQEFRSIKVPDIEARREYLMFEEENAQQVFCNMLTASLTADNFPTLYKECKDDTDLQKFIALLYDAAIQGHLNLELSQLYVLSELTHKFIFKYYSSTLEPQVVEETEDKKEVDIIDSSDVPDEKKDESSISNVPISGGLTLKAKASALVTSLLPNKSAASAERLRHAWMYLRTYQEHLKDANVGRLNNIASALMTGSDESSYLAPIKPEEIENSYTLFVNTQYKAFQELYKQAQSPQKQSSQSKPEATTSNTAGSQPQNALLLLLVNGFSSFFNTETSRQYFKAEENKGMLYGVKVVSTCTVGIMVYALSNTFLINVIVISLTSYQAYNIVIEFAPNLNLQERIYGSHSKVIVASTGTPHEQGL